MITSFIVGGTATTVIALRGVVGATETATSATLFTNEWGLREMLPPRIEREWLATSSS